MQIDENILITWGAVVKKYNKNETIFDEGAAILSIKGNTGTT